MEDRKQKEAEFHDEIRDINLEDNLERFEELTSNRKYYSAASKSDEYKNSFIENNCPGKRVLDYCCGDGDLSFLLAKNKANVTGIDISPTSIENCKREAEKRGFGDTTNFLVMDAENLQFEDNSFDFVIVAGVLHHLDISKAYSQLSKVLKPGGKILCGEPLVYNPIFQLYRRLTPKMRTEWEVNHILRYRDIKLAEKYFGKVNKRFFNLATLAAVPFLETPMFKPALSLMEGIDAVLLRIPLLRWWAWQIIFELSEPKKDGTEKTNRN